MWQRTLINSIKVPSRRIQCYTSQSKKTIPQPGRVANAVSWKSVTLAFVMGGGLLYYFEQEKKRIQKKREQDENKTIGRPKIGGPFTLMNHQGQTITDRDLQGRFNLIYFGFTHCPDICPTELIKISQVINKLKDTTNGKVSIQPVFITLDPKRDTVSVVNKYIKEFHPDFVGLTGTKEQIRQAAKAYRVYFSSSQVNENDDKDMDYLVDHSIITYLVGPDGQFINYYPQQMTADGMAEAILKHISDGKN